MQSLILSIRLERRWPLLGALAIIIGWIVVAVWRLVPAAAPHVAGIDVLAIAAAVLPPVALALLVVAMLPVAGRSLAFAELDPRLAETRALVDALVRDAAALDAAITHSAERIEALAAQPELVRLADNAATLDSAVARINASGRETGAMVAGFADALPALERTIAAVDTTLRTVAADSAEAFRGVEAMMAAVRARHHHAGTEAETTLTNLTALLARIDEASIRNTSALSKRAYALDAAVDGVLERSTAAVDGIHTRVVEQLHAIAGGLDGAGRQMGIFGDDGVRLFNQRLELLRRTSDDLQARLAAHRDDSASLQAGMEAWLDGLGPRIAAAGIEGGDAARAWQGETLAGIEAVAARMTGLRAEAAQAGDAIGAQLATITGRLAEIDAPVAAAGVALAGLEAQAAHVVVAMDAVEDGMAARLAASQAAISALESDAARLIDAVTALEAAADAGAAQIGQAATRLASEQLGLSGVAAGITNELDTARRALGDIEAGSENAAAAIEAGLASPLERLAVAVAATAATMQARLAAVLDEAVAALGDAAVVRAETAFGAPLQAQLRAVESAGEHAAATGQAAVGQLARSMLGLVETVNTVEARIGEVEARFAVRARDSMASRAMRIMRQLEASSIDIARLLRMPIGDIDWQRHLKGDHAVIAQVLVPQMDRDAARQMERLFRQDPAFNAEANHFCGLFETMVQRLLGDTDGEALAAILLSSDIGKLYAGIADATGRGAVRH